MRRSKNLNKNDTGGPMMVCSVSVVSKSRSIKKPKGSTRASIEEYGSGSKPTMTLPPSSGGNGSVLNTANKTLICIPNAAIKAIGLKKSITAVAAETPDSLEILSEPMNLINATQAEANSKLVNGPAN